MRPGFSSVVRIVRPINLVFIALTQFLLMYCLLLPTINHWGNEPLLGVGHFSLLVLSTILIAAAGYVINDYFDVKTDQVNRPGRVVVGKQLSRRKAMALHLTLNIIGISIGLYLAILVNRPWLASVHVFSAALLWFYSTYFKKKVLSGNVIVSLLTAIVPLVVLFYQAPSFQSMMFRQLVVYAMLYAVFAFIVSMMREIVKDMQDIDGDASDDGRTLPIVAGLKTSKMIVQCSGLLAILVLLGLQAFVLPQGGALIAIYVLFLVQLPLVFVMAKLKPADRSADFRILSYLIKGIMLTGILTMPLLCWLSDPATLFLSSLIR